MENKRIKKLIFLSIVMAVIVVFSNFTLASGELELPTPTEDELIINEDNNELLIEDEDLNSSSEKILNNMTRKEKRIAELADKYNDEFYGNVAYYLEVAQKYSLPICFIGLAIGAFNFSIVGNKKLDKKEQGFGWIVGFTVGLVIFNVLPLILALLVAGR